MVLKSIENLISSRLGFDLQTGMPDAVRCGCRERMDSQGLDDLAGYHELLRSSPEEIEQLIGRVVVGETWFFRDSAPFDFLAKLARAHCQGPLRVLSAPCSSGEEAYSIAITLLEAGLTPGQFSIQAVDVNREAIELARRGWFTTNSFREKGRSIDSRYLSPAGEGFQVCEEVRAAVRFHCGNVLNFHELAHGAPYDVIFFRNLLIYLLEEARDKMVGIVDRLLAPGGVVVLGHAEIRQVFFPNYQACEHRRSYAAQKPLAQAETPKAQALKAAPAARPARPTRPKAAAPPRPAMRPAPPVPRPQPAPQPLDAAEALSQARSLAGQGSFDRARELCRQVLGIQPASAEAHVLLGLIALGAGDEKLAEGLFGKVLYLDPNHLEALTHSYLLMEKRGSPQQAGRFKRRLSKLEGKPQSSSAES